MTSQTFADVAGRYARVMGRNSGVSVIFGPFNPETNKKVIKLPQLPAGTVIDPHQAKLFNGYLDHETGHHRFSDMDFYIDFVTEQERSISLLTNIFEDIRMENAQIDRYPGSGIYLDTIANECASKTLTKIKDGEKLTKNQLLFIMISQHTYTHRGITPNFLGGVTLNYFDSLQPVAELIDTHMPPMKTTQEAYELALKVKEYIEDHQDEIKEEMEQKCGGQSDESDEDGEGQSSQPGEGLPDLLNDSDGKEGGQGSSSQPGSGLPDLLNDGASGGAPGELTPEEHEFLKQLLEKGEQLAELMKAIQEDNGLTDEDIKEATASHGGWYEQTGHTILPPYTTEFDEIWTAPDPDEHSYKRSIERIGSNGSGASQALRVFLQSREKRGNLRGLDYGDLDLTHPNKVRARDKDIYTRKRVTKRINTDLLMLVDLSGSMPDDLTTDAAVSICEALKPIQRVKTAVVGFYTSTRCPSASVEPTAAYGRANPLIMPLFKGFDEPYHRAKYKLGAISCNGLTPLGEAYGHALEYLAPRRTPRRILWIISDGMPYFDRGSDEHSDFILMRQVQRNAERLGITTAGLEIGDCDFLHKYVKVSARINDITEITAAMHKMVRRFVGHPD